MPWRRKDDNHLVQFFVGPRVPFHVNRAREFRGLPSLSAWYREAVMEALAKDLGLSMDELREWMPGDWQDNPGAVKIDAGSSE